MSTDTDVVTALFQPDQNAKNALLALAKALYAFYNALTAAGFSSDEALQLIKQYQSQVFSRALRSLDNKAGLQNPKS